MSSEEKKESKEDSGPSMLVLGLFAPVMLASNPVSYFFGSLVATGMMAASMADGTTSRKTLVSNASWTTQCVCLGVGFLLGAAGPLTVIAGMAAHCAIIAADFYLLGDDDVDKQRAKEEKEEAEETEMKRLQKQELISKMEDRKLRREEAARRANKP